MKPWLLLTFLSLIGSCSTTVTSIKVGDNKTLKEGEGFILLGIETNLDLKKIVIEGAQNIELSSADIKAGTNYLLVDLKHGDYTIGQIHLNRYWRLHFEDDEEWAFRIEPGQINYVGHLELNRRGYYHKRTRAELVNRASEAVNFLEDNYSILMQNNTVVYGGPGQDFFLDFREEFLAKRMKNNE